MNALSMHSRAATGRPATHRPRAMACPEEHRCSAGAPHALAPQPTRVCLHGSQRHHGDGRPATWRCHQHYGVGGNVGARRGPGRGRRALRQAALAQRTRRDHDGGRRRRRRGRRIGRLARRAFQVLRAAGAAPAAGELAHEAAKAAAGGGAGSFWHLGGDLGRRSSGDSMRAGASSAACGRDLCRHRLSRLGLLGGRLQQLALRAGRCRSAHSGLLLRGQPRAELQQGGRKQPGGEGEGDAHAMAVVPQCKTGSSAAAFRSTNQPLSF